LAADEHSAAAEGLAGATIRLPDPRLRRQVFLRRDVLRYGPIAVIRHLWIRLAVLMAMFAVCAEVFHYYQQLDLVTSLLASVSTITTIGIYAPAGGLQSVPGAEKVELILIFLASVGASASIVQGVVSQVVNKGLWTEEVLRAEVARMRGQTIVMGYSYLGKYVAEKLDELRIPYVVVVQDRDDLARLRAEGVPAFGGPVTEFHRILEEVGVRRAATMICTFERDPDNLIAILYANKVKPELRIITTVHDRDLEASARMAGADLVLPTANILGDLLGLSAVSKEVAGVLLSAKIPGRYLAEFQIPGGRAFLFHQLNALAPVLLVLQDGQTISNPRDDFPVKTGSIILVLADPGAIIRIRHLLRGESAEETDSTG
jgi:voltage-gated potassium channel